MCLLWPISVLMGLVVAGRRAAYRAGCLHRQRLPVPVVVVGNRVAGGAGKTPTTMALLAHLTAKGWHPAVLSRGYKATAPRAAHGRSISRDTPLLLNAQTQQHLTASHTGDEPWLIWRRCQVPVMIGPDRGAAGLALLAEHPDTDVLVCDDGLQHLALARDVEVVVFDERGAGNGWLLPAGPLREPIDAPSGVVREGVPQAPLHVYNAARPSTPLPGHLAHKRLRAPAPLADWWAGRAAQSALAPGQVVWAAAGIAQPQRFFDALGALGLSVHGLVLPDHADWATLPWPPEATDVVVTEKDAVKLPPDRLAREAPGTRVWVSALDFHLDEAFWRAFDHALDAARR